ncbi:unnamed protein product [Ectocarpus fasciculatus]
MSSDDEPRMQFSIDNDFEGGKWINGEFYYSKKKGGARQSKDDQLYGVFQDASSGDDSGGDSEGGGLGRRKRQRRGGGGALSVKTRPVMFVSGSAQPQSAAEPSDTSNGAVSSAEEIIVDQSEKEEDSVAAKVKNIITSACVAPASSTNDAFRDMIKKGEEKEKEQAAAQQRRLSSAPVKDLGKWEKHTKGVGRKLLDKFGFKGRLGAKEDGISAAVEVKVRPNMMGLGFGDFVEASALDANKKLEAELKKEEYVPKKKEAPTSDAKINVFTVEKRAAAAAWKKGSAVGKSKKPNAKGVVFQDAMSMMKKSEAIDPSKPLFVDMRGPTPKVVSDIRSIDIDMDNNTEDSVADQPKLGQELLYNVNLMVESTDRELIFESRRLQQNVTRCSDLSAQREELSALISRDQSKLDSLKKIHIILSRMDEKIESLDSTVSPRDIFKALKSLKTEFPVEYNLLGISELVPHVCRRMESSKFGADWNPLEDPLLVADTFSVWFLGCSELEREGVSSEDQAALSASAAAPVLMHLVESLCLFKIRRCLSTEWVAKSDPESAVKLISSLYGSTGTFISTKEFTSMLSTAVMPRLKYEVEKWNPTVDTVPIHWWLHPWLPLLRSELSDVYPDIRRKLGRALANWDPADESALLLLSPWKGVFDDTSMDNLLQRAIVPKLVSSVRALPLDPQNTTAEHTKLFCSVLRWFKMVPSLHMVSILEGEFFPRWLQILSSWLSSESPEYSEITQWYLGWKSLLPEEMLADERVALYFNHALELMQHVLSGGECSLSVLPVGIPTSSSYFEVVDRRKKRIAAEKRLNELKNEPAPSAGRNADFPTGSGRNVSFKDLVEEFAMRHGVSFLPRTGRLQEGKQVFQFGKSSCYLDQGVVFLLRRKASGSSSWDPVTLEDMLASS